MICSFFMPIYISNLCNTAQYFLSKYENKPYPQSFHAQSTTYFQHKRIPPRYIQHPPRKYLCRIQFASRELSELKLIAPIVHLSPHCIHKKRISLSLTSDARITRAFARNRRVIVCAYIHIHCAQ